MGRVEGLELGNSGCVGARFICLALLAERNGRLTSVLFSCRANVIKSASDLRISEETLHFKRALNALRKWGKTSPVKFSPLSASRSLFMMPVYMLELPILCTFPGRWTYACE